MEERIVICRNCGKLTKGHHLKRRYCSRECYLENFKRRLQLQNAILGKRIILGRHAARPNCALCGKPNANPKKQVYCSDKCRVRAMINKKQLEDALAGKNVGSRTIGPRRETCLCCGAKLVGRQMKYCSLACKRKCFADRLAV